MKTEIFTICDFAQENNGKLTVVGTFDTLLAHNFPCVHPHLSVVIRMRFDLWEFAGHSFKVEARDINNELAIEPISGTLTVNSCGNTTAVTHLIFSIVNLRFPSDGLVNFILFLDDKEIASAPLYVRKAARPPAVPAE